MHKNWIYWRRAFIISGFELIIPCILLVIMIIIRQQIVLVKFPPQNFESTFVLIDTLEVADPTYIHYPLTYDPKAYNHSKSEREKFDFMSRAAMGRFQFDPRSCTKVYDPRLIIGLSPRNEFSEEILQ
jgi:hypothetical protein